MSDKQLRGVLFTGATIIEHRADGPVAGKVKSGEIDQEFSTRIVWQQFTSGNRTTVFASSSWDIQRDGNVIFLKRKDKDAGFGDLPWHNANLYSVVLST